VTVKNPLPIDAVNLRLPDPARLLDLTTGIWEGIIFVMIRHTPPCPPDKGGKGG